jgi:hypothetical protein
VVNTTDSIEFEDLVRKCQELQTLSSSTHIDFQIDENAFNFDYAIQESLKQKGINPKELDLLSSQNILDPSYMKDLFGYVPSKEEIELWNQEDKEFFQLFLQGAEDANLHLEPENLSLSGSSSPAFSQENSIQITSPTPVFQNQELLNQYDSLQKGLSFANQSIFPSLASSATPPIKETTDSDHASHNFYPAGGSVGEMNENLYAASNLGLTDKYTKKEMDTQTIDIISMNTLLGLPQIWG